MYDYTRQPNRVNNNGAPDAVKVARPVRRGVCGNTPLGNNGKCAMCLPLHFCNIYDAIGIERLEWEIVSYDREKRVHLDKANAYLPITRCKLLVHQVLSGVAYKPGWKMEVFGGSFHKDGTIESRLFKVEYDPGTDNKFGRFPYRLSITVGPGKRTATGGIAPEGKPTTQVQMRFPDDDFTGMCLEVRDFLLVHQRDLEQYRRNEQHTRFAERRSNGQNLSQPYAA